MMYARLSRVNLRQASEIREMLRGRIFASRIRIYHEIAISSDLTFVKTQDYVSFLVHKASARNRAP